jgi:hypothetical protein
MPRGLTHPARSALARLSALVLYLPFFGRERKAVSSLATSAALSSRDSNVGKWDRWYRKLSPLRENPILYGDPTTYLMAAAFLADMEEVEDWGCGAGGFRRFCQTKYIGVDGSRTPFADKIVDLCHYESNADGIVLRHVLEHNYDWEKILVSAVRSFRRKLCLVLFTPFSELTHELPHNRTMNRAVGVDVVDMSFAREDIEKHFSGLSWKLIQEIKTRSLYGREQIYLVWRN